jgi:hypothetical protein
VVGGGRWARAWAPGRERRKMAGRVPPELGAAAGSGTSGIGQRPLRCPAAAALGGCDSPPRHGRFSAARTASGGHGGTPRRGVSRRYRLFELERPTATAPVGSHSTGRLQQPFAARTVLGVANRTGRTRRHAAAGRLTPGEAVRAGAAGSHNTSRRPQHSAGAAALCGTANRRRHRQHRADTTARRGGASRADAYRSAAGQPVSRPVGRRQQAEPASRRRRATSSCGRYRSPRRPH